MKFNFNAGSAQFADFALSPLDYVGKTCFYEHEKGNVYSEQALRIRVAENEEEALGYIPENKGIFFHSHDAFFDALYLDIPMTLVVKEAVYKDSAGRYNKKGKGKFVFFTFEVDARMGDASPSYQDETGKEYLRLTRILDKFKWDAEDKAKGLEDWMIGVHRDGEHYRNNLALYAFEGSVLHHRAELLLEGITMPEEVTPTPPIMKEMIDAVTAIHGKEVRLYDKEIDVAGTYDAFVDLNGVTTILDWKRSKHMSEKYYRQVSFYAKNVGAEQAKVVLLGADKAITVTKSEIEKYYQQVTELANMIRMVNA